MSSIREELSENTIANQVVLERRQSRRTIVLVEGGSDARYLRKFVDKERAALTVCHNRDKLMLTLGVLRERGITGVVGIADKDFDDFLDPIRQLDDPDVVVWDQNDLESTILPDVVDKILDEFASEAKLEELRENTGELPLGLVAAEAAKIGALRITSHRRNLSLRFNGMTYQFTSATSFAIDLRATIDHVLSRSETDEEADDLEVECGALIDSEHTDLAQSRGHDLMRILGRAMRRSFGSVSTFDKNDPNKNPLYSILRIAHENEQFRNLRIFEKIKDWESANDPWIVLKAA